jgi:hypothetical protein
VCEPDKHCARATAGAASLSVDRSFLLRHGEAQQSSVAVARRDFVPAAQTAETA